MSGMLTEKAQAVCDRLDLETPRMGEIKKVAAEIKKDHELALELWGTGGYVQRMLSTLIMDKTQLTLDVVEGLAKDMAPHSAFERGRLSEWLMAHQLMKSKKTTAFLENWEHHPLPVLRRLFWYHQARLRWTGKVPPDNTEALMESLQKNLASEESEVQWAMNFTAAQIGIHQLEYRDACIKLGEKVGLYKDLPVPRGCAPDYLPDLIAHEAKKYGTL